jgi:opacity protein-like surface antigen
MRKIILAFTMAVLASAAGLTHASAADLGAPKTVAAAIPEPVKDQWTGLYFEFGAAGQFMKGEKNAAGLAGIGYNYHTFGNPLVVGVFLRYGFSAEGNSDAAVLSFDQPLTAAIRAGYLVAPSTLIYGLAGYSKSLDTDYRGPLIGAGVEAPVLGSLRLSLEYSAMFDKTFKADADVVHNIGVFARLPF